MWSIIFQLFLKNYKCGKIEKLYQLKMTRAKCTEIKMWKICTGEIKKNMFKCTEKYAQYKQGLWVWVKICLK